MSNSKDRETLRLLYGVSINDIRFSKRQQWYVMYLTVIAIAGILSLSLKLLCDHTILGILLFLSGIIIPFLGWLTIEDYGKFIEEKYRPRTKKIQEELVKELSEKVQGCFERKPEEDKNEDKKIVWAFRVVIILVLAIAITLHLSLWSSCPDCP